MRTILTSIESASIQVDALGSLAGAIVAGLRAGTVDPDHIETLISGMQSAIKLRLRTAAAAAEQLASAD